MADRAEVTKVTAYAMTGQDDAAKVPKVVAYLLLEPGLDSGETAARSGTVFSNVMRKPD